MPPCPFCHVDLAEPIPDTCPTCGKGLAGLNDRTINDPDQTPTLKDGAPALYAAETIPLPEPLPPMPEGKIDALWAETVTDDVPQDTTVKKAGKSARSTSHYAVKPRDVKDIPVGAEQAPSVVPPTTAPPDYELIKILGEGGMGVVYAARQTSIDREIAIKMIKGNYAASSKARDKFLVEAAVTGDLDHPNIVPIHDLGTNEAGHLFYSMKQVRGTEWKAVIREKSTPENLDILMRVADAVAFAHSRGVIHRDLKPENVMLGDFGEVLVMDWGLAASVTPEGKADSLSETGIGGTPPYMAPEMASGDAGECGARSDVYLLGAILYEIISGKKPHTATTVRQCLMNAARNIIQPIEEKGELVSIALKAMATKPQDRFATVKDFQEAIREYQSHAESVVLAKQADKALTQAAQTKNYGDYARAMFTFEQALELWEKNDVALNGASAARFAYANCAYEKGDYAQAESLLREAKRLDTPLGKKVLRAKAEQEARVRRVRTLTRTAVGLAAAVILILTGAFFWIRAKEQRALEAERDTRAALARVEEEKEATALARDRANAAKRRALAAQANAEAEKKTADEERERAETVSGFMTVMLSTADPMLGGKTLTVLRVMKDMSKAVAQVFKDDDRTRLQLQAVIGSVYLGHGRYAEAESHLRDAEMLAQKIFGKEHPAYAASLNNLALLYQAQGQYAKAEPLYREAITIKKKALGVAHPTYASSLNNLANLYQAQGQYAQAEPLYRDALAIRKKALGAAHPDYAGSLNNLANLYQAQGQYAQAEPLYRDALAIRKKYLGAAHPDYADSLNNLANLYQAQGQYAQAEPLYREALAVRKNALGAEHPTYAASLNNLAGLYQEQGQYAQAEPLYRDAMTILKKALGTAHPRYVSSLNNLAALYYRQSQYAQAEPLYREALAVRKKALGVAHPAYAASLNNLAILYQAQGQYAQAEPLHREALAIRKKALGVAHPDYAESLNNLAELCQAQGQYAQAEPLLKDALAIRKKILGAAHPAYARSLNNLANLYQKQGQYAQAEPFYREVVAIRKKILGAAHPAYAASLNNLAEMYKAQGQYAQAEPLYREAIVVLKKARGVAHPDYAQSLNNLAVLYYAQDQYAKAGLLFQEALAIRKKALGVAHPTYAASLNNLAGLYQAQGQYAQAEPLLQEAMAIRKKTLGAAHPDYAESLNNLAGLYYAQGKYAQTERLIEQALAIYRKTVGENHPKYRSTANNLLLLRQKQAALAVKELEAALKPDPILGPKGIYWFIARDAEARKDWPEKLAAYKHWVAAAPKSVAAQSSYARELLTSKDKTLRDPKTALTHAQKAAQLTQHKNPAILDTLALAFFENGQVAEAAKTQKNAVSLLPKNTPPASRKEYTERLKKYQDALQKAP